MENKDQIIDELLNSLKSNINNNLENLSDTFKFKQYAQKNHVSQMQITCQEKIPFAYNAGSSLKSKHISIPEITSDLSKFIVPTSDQQNISDSSIQPKFSINAKPPEMLSSSESNLEESSLYKKIHRPYANFLPSKHKETDVTQLFPEFRHGKPIRFQRLFESKELPPIWSGVKNKKKVLNRKEENIFNNISIQASSTVPQEDEQPPVFNISCSSPSSYMVESDDEEKLISFTPRTISSQHRTNMDDIPMDVRNWRYGPAKFWYDKNDVPENGEGFDYGFKISKNNSLKEQNEIVDYPDDAYLMVTQNYWEDDVIWDGKVLEENVKNSLYKKKLSGWIPTKECRTWAEYNNYSKILSPIVHSQLIESSQQTSLKDNKVTEKNINKNNTWWSLFPTESDALINKKWEDDVIWDSESMNKEVKPSIFTLDLNDENIILNVCEPQLDVNDMNESIKTKKDIISKSRVILGKAGIISEPEPVQQPENIEKDPFNISNDEYYSPYMFKTSILKSCFNNNNLCHSIPASKLHPLLFPTHMHPLKRENFHRPPLKHYSHGYLSHLGFHGVYLSSTNQLKFKDSVVNETDIICKEKYFVEFQDLTGKNDELVLFEYSEEHAPLMMQVGMATKIKNYYKRGPDNNSEVPQYKYGEPTYIHTSPFLGSLYAGQSLQTLENNLFRSPIYAHQVPETDFIIIRTRHNYFIRHIENLFVVGQELPLYEVPYPNSKKANHFVQNFLQVFIYRLFQQSKDNPPRIKMDDIKKAFPSYSDSYIRKQLKMCADFRKSGIGTNWWILKTGHNIPSEEDIEKIVSPEDCCSYYSMLAAEQRLKDAGYAKKSLFSLEEEEDEFQLKTEDEIKAAPWNTTRAFISAVKGECLLELTGVADPTGCGEGFSYIKIPFKHKQWRDDGNGQIHTRKMLTGTDADLRRLSLRDAKQLLKQRNVPEDEISKLSRWEIIDVVRTLSTEQAKTGEEDISKYARGNRFCIEEYQRKYKEECERLFVLQNHVLSSKEILSTDEESCSEDDSEIEAMAKDIEIILSTRKTISQIQEEHEEKERIKLQKLITETVILNKKDSATTSTDMSCNINNKILKIYRKYRDFTGRIFSRIEIVRNASVIDTYVRIRTTKDQKLIRQLALASNAQEKEEIRKERRRIQDQLRRLKRHEKKINNDVPKKKQKLEKKEPLLKVKCGACGTAGHMKTNRICPLYKPPISFPAVQVAMTEEQKKEQEIYGFEDRDLVKVDETKVVISKQIIKHIDEVRRKSLILKIPRNILSIKKRKHIESAENCGYRKIYSKKRNRQKTDPLLTLTTIFENILKSLRNVTGSQLFWYPINTKKFPDYGKNIHYPMDLQTIENKLRQQKYPSRELFFKDIKQIVINSKEFNGNESIFTRTAQKMEELCLQLLNEKKDHLRQLEKTINPQLDDNGQLCFSNILEIITKELKTIPGSLPFHSLISKKSKIAYRGMEKRPITLNIILNKVRCHKYQNRLEFRNDINLLFSNKSSIYGPGSKIAAKAKEMITVCNSALEKWKPKLIDCEIAIANARNKCSKKIDLNVICKPFTEFTNSSSTENCTDNSKDFDTAINEHKELKKDPILNQENNDDHSENLKETLIIKNIDQEIDEDNAASKFLMNNNLF